MPGACQEIEELRSICCEQSHRARQARTDELSLKQERNPTTVSQMVAQIREIQNKVNSLSVARELYDPETASSSGATHVPDRNSTILSPRTLPRYDSGLPRDTLNGAGLAGNVFERPLAQEGLSSTIFNNSKKWHHLPRDRDLILQKQQGERNKKRIVEHVGSLTPFPK